VWRDDNGSWLQCPWGVAVDASGSVFITDYFANQIVKLDAEGNILELFGRQGAGGAEFNGPAGIALDKDGNIYVTDYRNNRVQKLDSSGEPMTMWGHYGHEAGQFRSPTGIAVDSTGHVYVGDYLNDRIQTFSLDTMPPSLMGMRPADGEADVDPASSIDLVFDEPMDQASVDEALTVSSSSGLRISGYLVWSDGSTLCSFVPSAMLQQNATYAVRLQGGAMDAAGNGMPSEIEVTFRTATANATTIVVEGSPLSGSQYTAENPTVDLAGSILDSSTVVSVTWINDRGGSGVASGTAVWDIPDVKLSSGVNNITITVQYASGKTNSQAISVAYQPPDPTSQYGSDIPMEMVFIGVVALTLAGGGGLYLWRRRRSSIR